jgi:hypothetical protein
MQPKTGADVHGARRARDMGTGPNTDVVFDKIDGFLDDDTGGSVVFQHRRQWQQSPVERPEVCVKGAQTMALLGERTREGAKVAYHLFEGQFGNDTELAKAPIAEQDAVTDKISTGTIDAGVTKAVAQPNAEPELATMRIPVPMRRPQGY